jgi:hypothetical protein
MAFHPCAAGHLCPFVFFAPTVEAKPPSGCLSSFSLFQRHRRLKVVRHERIEARDAPANPGIPGKHVRRRLCDPGRGAAVSQTSIGVAQHSTLSRAHWHPQSPRPAGVIALMLEGFPFALKAGITAARLEHQGTAMSDNDAAKHVKQTRKPLFQSISRQTKTAA